MGIHGMSNAILSRIIINIIGLYKLLSDHAATAISTREFKNLVGRKVAIVSFSFHKTKITILTFF